MSSVTSPFNFKQGETLLFDKPIGWTSFQMVNRVRGMIRRLINERNIKVGHAGTLDPLATGLLVLCTGHSTKKIDLIQAAEKQYTGTIFLGATRPSYDMETPVDATFPTDSITEDSIRSAAKTFEGAIDQIPPVFSAKMVEGERSYDLARKGEAKELAAKRVTITAFLITDVRKVEGGIEADFDVTCSKGTYIRSLAHDLGQKLGCGGYLQSLRRTRIGEHKVEDALTAEQFHFLLFGEGPRKDFDGRIEGRG